jgi:transcriptional regulator with XRE-family HTH domain
MSDAEFLKRLGMEIKVERIRKGLSQLQLAELSNMAVGAIGEIERGVVDGRILAYKRISDALGKGIEELM